MPPKKNLTPPYIAFKTFLSTLDSFRTHLPDRIDETLLPEYSTAVRCQLRGALRFLGLIDKDGTPTDALKKLVRADDQARRVQFRNVMRGAYGLLMRIDLEKATRETFDLQMRKLGQKGQTLRKVTTFFLLAAEWAGVSYSPLLTTRVSRFRTGELSISELGSVFPKASAESSPIYVVSNGGSKKELVLSGGSKLYLSTDTDLFKMNSEDRTFVMKLLDIFDEYERADTLSNACEATEEVKQIS